MGATLYVWCHFKGDKYFFQERSDILSQHIYEESYEATCIHIWAFLVKRTLTLNCFQIQNQ